ncbi:hypothetical protein N7534_012040 [Penicillium rubens]|nr:hypothetical protein N7534_012040 [Penicillium rubens]
MVVRKTDNLTRLEWLTEVDYLISLPIVLKPKGAPRSGWKWLIGLIDRGVDRSPLIDQPADCPEAVRPSTVRLEVVARGGLIGGVNWGD